MNKYLRIIFIIFIVLNLFFAAWYLLHGDIYFNTDIARDFLLLDELQQKKMVLIGPRASGQNGFFHGPLWMYLNFPLFWISKGDPLTQGWFWFGLIIIYLTSAFFLWKRKIGADKSLMFVTFLSLFFTLDPDRGFFNGFYNPFGALFLMPLFLYFLHSYITEKKWIHLLFLLLTNGLIVQFQIAFGAPLLILTSLWIFYITIRHKSYHHLFCFSILLLPFSTYIVFDLRHHFSHFRALFLPTPNPYLEKVSFISMIMERIEAVTGKGLHFFREPLTSLNFLMGLLITFIVYFIYKSRNNKTYMWMFLYYFLGYYLLSLLHNGWLMYFYWMPLYPLVFLFFIQSKKYLPQTMFYAVVFFVIIVNTLFNLGLTKQSSFFIGKKQNSWKFQSSMIETVFKDAKQKEFGFFVRAPDIFGYGSKYPFVYFQKRYPNTKMAIYEKKPLTYIVVEPAPKHMPWMDNEFIWWKKNKLHIATEAAQITYFNSGFRIEKYILQKKDIESPIEPGINDWIYFR